MSKFKLALNKKVSILNILSVIILTSVIGLGVNLVFAWVGPSSNPPICPSGSPGCDPPITEAGGQTINGNLTVGGQFYPGRQGMAGTYHSTEIQNIWSINSNYFPNLSGTGDFADQYGMSYCYTNNANCVAGYGHQIDIVQNGVVGIALGMGGSAWFKGSLTVGGYLYVGTNQFLYGDDSSQLRFYSNHDTISAMRFLDKVDPNTGVRANYGYVYGSGNGANFGLLDGDGNWSYRATKDTETTLYINAAEKLKLDTDSLNLGGKEAIRFSDTWLRLNQAGSFTSGVHTPGNLNIFGTIYDGEGPLTLDDNVDVTGNLNVTGIVRPGNYTTAAMPTCNAAIRGALAFDTTLDKPVVCTSTGWKDLDRETAGVWRRLPDHFGTPETSCDYFDEKPVKYANGDCISVTSVDWNECNNNGNCLTHRYSCTHSLGHGLAFCTP